MTYEQFVIFVEKGPASPQRRSTALVLAGYVGREQAGEWLRRWLDEVAA